MTCVIRRLCSWKSAAPQLSCTSYQRAPAHWVSSTDRRRTSAAVPAPGLAEDFVGAVRRSSTRAPSGWVVESQNFRSWVSSPAPTVHGGQRLRTIHSRRRRTPGTRRADAGIVSSWAGGSRFPTRRRWCSTSCRTAPVPSRTRCTAASKARFNAGSGGTTPIGLPVMGRWT